jgi:hypothetical protein
MVKSRGCVQQTTAKYRGRPSPAFPANECCDQIMMGNDGDMYISKRASNGVCRWVPYHGEKLSKPTKKIVKKSTKAKKPTAKKSAAAKKKKSTKK